MMMSEKDYIDHCKKQIELKYNLDGSSLAERDYEFLHRVILEETKTDLSTSTLRRLWTNHTQSVPQIKTLDALAQLIGYAGWHAYKQSFSNTKKKTNGKAKRMVLYCSGLALIAMISWLFVSSNAAVGEAVLEPEVLIHEGVPATIGFNYKVPNPEVEIELSWNPYERVTLDMENNFYTGTYYYPDYHKAKLIHEGQVLAQEAVHITTPGWHALLMDSGMDTRPQYVDNSAFRFPEYLKISKETIKKLAKESDEIYPVFTLSNAALNQLSGDHFSLLAEVTMETISEETLCLMYEVLIKGSKGNMRIPVAQDGCYGIAMLSCAEKRLSGKFHDLSSLTTDLTAKHWVKISSDDQKLNVQVGDNQVYELNYEQKIGSVKVIKFIFNGLPEIDAFELRNENGEVVKTEALYPFHK